MNQKPVGVFYRCGWLLLWKAVLRLVVGFGLTVIVAFSKVWVFAFALGVVTFVWSGVYVLAHIRSRLLFNSDGFTVVRPFGRAESFSLSSANGRLVKVWWNAGGRVLEVCDDARRVKVPCVAVIPWGNARLIGPRLAQVSAELEHLGLRING